MIPQNETFDDFVIEDEPSYTYYLDIEKSRVAGYVDDVEAVKQFIYKLLNTEKNQYPVYDNFGIELEELIGQERSYAVPEIERRITEALLEDERISGVGEFVFQFNKSKYHVTFEVYTIWGTLEIESEVAA